MAQLAIDIQKNSELLSELQTLVIKQQLLISKAFQGGIEERRKKGNAQRIQAKLREKKPIPQGCRVRVWKQDPSVKELGIRTVFLPNEVSEGPSDKLIKVIVDQDQKCKAIAKPDSNGDFLVNADKDIYTFDLVQVYSVVRMVINMYERDLQIDWRWQWDLNAPGVERTPISIVCHAGVKQNASYLRSKKMMKFYYFNDADQKKDIYLCRSMDIVAHETGHAVMDALKPKLYDKKEGQEGALHEAFADMTAIFLLLSQMDLCEDVIADSKANLRATRYLSAIGEEFAEAVQDEDPEGLKGSPDEPAERHNSVGRGCRDTNNKFKGSEAKSVYDLAQVFTGYVFDVLVAVFEHERNPALVCEAETLFKVARILRRIFLLALYNTSEMPNFIEVSKAMEHAVSVVVADDDIDLDFWKEAIVKYRVVRELAEAGVDSINSDIKLNSNY